MNYDNGYANNVIKILNQQILLILQSSPCVDLFLDLANGSNLFLPLGSRVGPEHLVHNTKELCGEGVENAAEVDADVRERG